MDKLSDKILFQIANAEDKSNVCIRDLVPIINATERECEIEISSLINLGYIKDVKKIIGPKTKLFLSQKGEERVLEINRENVTVEEATITHVWYRVGDYGSGAGQITRDKWFPMGSICTKCGINTKQFNKKPTICPKFVKK